MLSCGPETPMPPPPITPPRLRAGLPPQATAYVPPGYGAYPVAGLLVALAVVAAEAINLVFLLPNVTPLFLAAVFFSAVLWGVGPAIFAAILSAAAAAYFYFPPLYDFRVHEPQDLVDLAVFSVISVAAGDLAARTRRQALDSQRREETTAALYAFSRRLAGIIAADELYLAVIEQLGQVLERRVVLLLPDADRLVVFSAVLSDNPLAGPVHDAATRLWRSPPPAAEVEIAADATVWRLRQIRTGRQALGVLAVGSDIGAAPPEIEPSFLDALIDQASIAIERTQLAATLENARVQAKTETLREALLNSISHDLQTPLASILGAAGALQSFGSLYDPAAQRDLVATIHEEGERLNHFIGNILHLTRIRAGAVTPRLEFVEPADIINAALRRLDKRLAAHEVSVDLPADLPMLRLDLFLTKNALVNILENAAKYSLPGSRIRIRARQTGDNVAVEISDEGAGIASGDLPRVFDQFYRAHDAMPAGSGLGLAIARTFIEANSGHIDVRSDGPGRGASFCITLPVPAEQPAAPSTVED